jgi:hypothetical protein
MKTSLELNKKIFLELKGKQVKLLIRDIDKHHFIRGKIIDVGEGILLIKGDYSEQIIAFDSIVKITHNLTGGLNG